MACDRRLAAGAGARWRELSSGAGSALVMEQSVPFLGAVAGAILE